MEPVPPAGASVPIGLREWIEITPCDASYVESAVGLAWLLTRHLCEAIESRGGAGTAPPSGDFVRAEDVVVRVGLPSETSARDGLGRVPPIAGVAFARREAPGGPSAVPRPGPRSLSAALGEVLLEIFSRGRSSALRGRIRDASNDNGSGCPPYPNGTPSVGDTPSVLDQIQLLTFLAQQHKRRATVPADDSPASAARDLLLSSGMPLSICQLVGDLLDSENNPTSDAVALVAEALGDLTQMKTTPHKFLFDRTCPKRALDDTCLFGRTDAHFIGREGETRALMTAMNNVTAHVRAKSDPFGGEGASEADAPSTSSQDGQFLSEAVFLSGCAGSGKSTLIHRLTRACDEDRWFVLGCKFDKQSAPHMVMTKAFDDFFGKWGLLRNDAPLAESFRQVCSCICSALDEEGLAQLCDLVPNFAVMFPVHALRGGDWDEDEVSSMEKIGAAKERLQNLFRVLVNALCSAGHPVLFTFDDLQWSEGFDVIDLVVNCIPDLSGALGGTCRKGILVAGTYRSDEVGEGDDLVRSIGDVARSGRANVTMLTVGEMHAVDINKLLSAKLCLPWRRTRELANFVRAKTRGNPFFVVLLLRSIIRNKLLTFSVKSRRWVWDCDTLNVKLISDGAAELLLTSFCGLSPNLMQTLQILSCLGSQVEESTIVALDSRISILSFDMRNELPLAVREGIMEKAGPVYQFTHDIIQTTIYELIPPGSRKLLHKCIGMKLLQSAANNPTICLLAADQVNFFCNGDNPPTQEESSLFANSNAVAAKLAIVSSSFDQGGL